MQTLRSLVRKMFTTIVSKLVVSEMMFTRESIGDDVIFSPNVLRVKSSLGVDTTISYFVGDGCVNWVVILREIVAMEPANASRVIRNRQCVAFWLYITTKVFQPD